METNMSLPLSAWQPNLSTQSFEARFGNNNSGLLISCEHANNGTGHFSTTAEEKELLHSHWGWDKGAAIVAKELAMHFDCFSIFGQQSRLICDLNRTAEDINWIRTEIKGKKLTFNQQISLQERNRRLQRVFFPYHKLLNQAAQVAPSTLLSVHSMTPVYEGNVREMDIAVLHCGHATEAHALALALASMGFSTAINKPYSGLDATTSPLHTLAARHQMPVLWLEINQRLVGSVQESRELGRDIAVAMDRWQQELLELATEQAA